MHAVCCAFHEFILVIAGYYSSVWGCRSLFSYFPSLLGGVWESLGGQSGHSPLPNRRRPPLPTVAVEAMWGAITRHPLSSRHCSLLGRYQWWPCGKLDYHPPKGLTRGSSLGVETVSNLVFYPPASPAEQYQRKLAKTEALTEPGSHNIAPKKATFQSKLICHTKKQEETDQNKKIHRCQHKDARNVGIIWQRF